MTYTEATEYIHSISWTFCKPGLERIRELCAAIGDPQKRLRFIHVAGTNGKGSFCAMTDSILRCAGYKVGLFTSPYITRFNERMRINGENISDRELCSLVEYVKPYADKMTDKPTEFELITAIAFLYFERHQCDVVVLECGLGGRLDATNIIDSPTLSVITGISLDHTAILGDTVEKIAAEKAGIIKRDTPCLWCGSSDSARAVISEKAKELSAPLYVAQKNSLKINEMTLDGTKMDFSHYKDVELSLLGGYQPSNAANVLTAIDILNSIGFSVSEDAVREGLRRVRWQARFELISRYPVIIADGGHNPEGIDGAVSSVEKYFADTKLGVITGVMADKDYSYMAKRISTVAAKVFCITPDNPRALPAKDYACTFAELGVESVACEGAEEAVAAAIAWSRVNGAPIISLGSLYMYAEIAEAVKKYTT